MTTPLGKAVVFILLLGVLILVHELGHFLVAKALRVKVLRLSIGFGPPLLSFRRGETEYWIATVPLGGYVKLLGDDPRAELPPEDRGRGVLEQAPWRRLLIYAAGPLMNLLLPLVVFLGMVVGNLGEDVYGNVVGTVFPGSPAAQAGLRPGDRILSITGPDGETTRIRDFEDSQKAIVPQAGRTVNIAVEREGKALSPVPVAVQRSTSSNGVERFERGIIGIMPYYTPARVGPVAPGAAGALEPFDLVVAAGGEPVANAVELERAVAAAGCGPIDLEVVRERPQALPGAVLADVARERLAGVPTCRDGKPTFRNVDPWVSATIAAVEPGGPADRAGLRRGDTITAVNGQPVHTFMQLVSVVNRELQGGKPGAVTLADGRTVGLAAEEVVTRNQVTGKDDRSWWIGLSEPRQQFQPARSLVASWVPYQRTPVEVVQFAAEETAKPIRLLVVGVAKMFTNEVSPEQVGSIIQVAVVVGDAVEQGLDAVLLIMAFISVNLGVMNLLPIPVLDGGRIGEALVETVTRRPLSLRMREVTNAIGLVLLISLMVFAFRNDIVRWLEGRNQPVAEEPVR